MAERAPAGLGIEAESRDCGISGKNVAFFVPNEALGETGHQLPEIAKEWTAAEGGQCDPELRK